MKLPLPCAFLQRAGFHADDRLAVVLIHRASREVVQRIHPVSQIVTRATQAWLQRMNQTQEFEVYLSVNTLQPHAKTRTKKDIAEIRHLFLDFDRDADARLPELLRRTDLPQPHALINSSRNHWQILWRVSGFTAPQAEALQRGLARDTGADSAATDCARVLRYPGFVNHKYAPPWSVSAQYFGAHRESTPQDFPATAFQYEAATIPVPGVRQERSPHTSGALSQSERDWAYAKRSLALGRTEQAVIAAIAANRTDKHNPLYYARLTVRKAAAAVANDPQSQKYLRTQS